MRQKGSILVVVLGLLAILAVIGVAFLTLSSLERSTATSFALQTQMMIAADGALDYAVHQMVIDVWEWNVTSISGVPVLGFTGNLLTGRIASGTSPKTPPYYAAGELYDYPSAAADPWLSSPIVSNAKPTWISFEKKADGIPWGVKLFGINFGTSAANTATASWPDNLGFPVDASARKPNGLWIPDLAAPCDQYLLRASVTVLDHNALVNLNAHGNTDTGAWEYGDCIGKGYFISDVKPVSDTSTLSDLLIGTGSIPGCWGTNGPGNSKTGAVLIENPAAGNDVPYTLDEEFELRNLWGTYFKSRLEWIGAIPDTDPGDYPIPASGYAQRLKTTTVSWTAEVRGDGNAAWHATMKDGGADLGWSAAKADLNTALPDDIYQALRDGRVMEDGDELKQLVANIVAFRSRSNDFDVDFGGKVGAERQPFFSEVTAEGSLNSDSTAYVWTIKVELFNPWPGDASGDTDGLTVTGMTVVFGTATLPPLAGKIPGGQCHPTTFTHTASVPNTPGALLKDTLSSIKLQKGAIALDEITTADIAKLDGPSRSKRLYRPIDWEYEKRGTNHPDAAAIPVVYIGDWMDGGTAGQSNFGTVNKQRPAVAIPIRFPNCVGASTALAPRPQTAAGEFKAFARIGDLNQVLRGTGANFWPWVVTVAKLAARTDEATVKFDWMKNINDLNTPGAVAAARAANVLSAGGPWNDGLDNDGDTQTDFADTGQPGGPEFRVAGKINLNTANDATLDALSNGLGIGDIKTIVKAKQPLKSPAQLLSGGSLTAMSDPEAKGWLEERDLRFTRLSNIATVRSDTFSIYGTVQIVDPKIVSSGSITNAGIVRSRRFWALVDRSPSLAYPPGNANFIRPRILNFQWLD
ncbi:MAG: hypothetical protein WBC39_07745 [Phycisphaerae bacterium]